MGLDLALIIAANGRTDHRARLVAHLAAKFEIDAAEVAASIDTEGVPILADDVVVSLDLRAVL